MREGTAAQALHGTIEGRVPEHHPSDPPPHLMDAGEGRGWREIDLRAPVDEIGRQIVPDRQNPVEKSIVDAELQSAPEILTRAACQLALDPEDTDVSAPPMGGRCKI